MKFFLVNIAVGFVFFLVWVAIIAVEVKFDKTVQIPFGRLLFMFALSLSYYFSNKKLLESASSTSSFQPILFTVICVLLWLCVFVPLAIKVHVSLGGSL